MGNDGAGSAVAESAGTVTVMHEEGRFRDQFADVFRAQHGRLFRFMDRLSGDPDLASDLAQEAFVRLYQRGSLPDQTEAWLITVAMNLFRNFRTTTARRRELLAAATVAGEPTSQPRQADGPGEIELAVRSALQQLGERDRAMLLLRAEDYSYRDIAHALDVSESSVGTLLARAKRAFMEAYRK